MILESLLVVNSIGITALSVLGGLAFHKQSKLAAAKLKAYEAKSEQIEAGKRAMNEMGRRLASGADLPDLMRSCLDPECPEHGGKKNV